MRFFIKLIMIVSILSSLLLAQSGNQFYDRNRYSEAINELLRTHADQTGMSDQNLRVLGLALRNRAKALQDARDLMIKAGIEYHAMLDTLKIPVSMPFQNYFSGRFLFAAGDYQGALKRFRQAAADKAMEKDYAVRAQIWSGACLCRLSHAAEARSIWDQVFRTADIELKGELAYAAWTCADSTYASAHALDAKSKLMQLWKACVARDLGKIQRFSAELWKNWDPAESYRVRYTTNGKTIQYQVNYFDPQKMEIMIWADYFAAEQAFDKVRKIEWRSLAQIYAAACALETGRTQAAEAHLNISTDDKKDIYLGVLAALKGDPKEAERRWQRYLTGRSGKDIYAWFDAVCRLSQYNKLVERTATRLTASAKNMDDAESMGRALLLAGNDALSFSILDRWYPRDRHNDPEKVEPSYLLLLAHSKYCNWRKFQTDLLGHVVCQMEQMPAVHHFVEMMKLVMMPDKSIIQIQVDH